MLTSSLGDNYVVIYTRTNKTLYSQYLKQIQIPVCLVLLFCGAFLALSNTLDCTTSCKSKLPGKPQSPVEYRVKHAAFCLR